MRILLYVISVCFNLVPDFFIHALAVGLGNFFFYVVRFRRSLILENLRGAYRSEKTEFEFIQIAHQNYVHYALTLFEIIKSISWSKDDFLMHSKRENFQALHKVISDGTGAFLVTGHFGNWEIAILSCAAAGIPLDVVVKRSNSPYFDELLAWYRTKTGARLFYESGNLSEIQKSLKEGRVVAFVVDQFMGPPIGLPVQFFGRQAGTAAGLALLLERREVPVLMARSYREPNQKLRLIVEDPILFKNLEGSLSDRLYTRTQKVNDILEKFVREAPEQWLWLHRRWKEFLGESRWRITLGSSASVVSVFLLSFFIGCVSKEPSPTGIALPADPNIEVPTLSNVSYENEAPSQPVPTSIVSPTPSPEPKKKKEKKMTEPGMPAPSPTPVPKVFTIVPVDKVPFEVGERLEVDLRWTALPAGRAVMEVREGVSVNGRPTYHLWGNVISSKIVDAVYHVDNTAESFIDKSGFMPYKYLLHMVESKQLKETRVAFDHAKGKAYFWSKRISERWGNEEQDRQDNLVPQARDIWSALYYSRALNYQLGKEQSFTVYENGQNWNVSLKPVAQELVNTSVGTFQCWKIQVNVNLNNILKPMGDTFMWLSDDSKKYLVKFDTKIKIGSLNGILTSVREH